VGKVELHVPPLLRQSIPGGVLVTLPPDDADTLSPKLTALVT
jgi:hypothetical protein